MDNPSLNPDRRKQSKGGSNGNNTGKTISVEEKTPTSFGVQESADKRYHPAHEGTSGGDGMGLKRPRPTLTDSNSKGGGLAKSAIQQLGSSQALSGVGVLVPSSSTQGDKNNDQPPSSS